MKKCNVTIFELIVASVELSYKLNYRCQDGKNFITIDNIALRKLCRAYSENILILYTVLNYMFIKVIRDYELDKYIVSNVEEHITQEWM